jgi:hypothetical protein
MARALLTEAVFAINQIQAFVWMILYQIKYSLLSIPITKTSPQGHIFHTMFEINIHLIFLFNP